MEPLGDDSLVVVGQAGGILTGRAAMTYSEVAEHPLVGLDPGSSLRRWTGKRLGPAVRYRTTVADLGLVVALAAAAAGLAVVPRRAVDPGQPLDVCRLQDAWARRDQLPARGATSRHPAADALAEHLRRAARDGGGLRYAVELEGLLDHRRSVGGPRVGGPATGQDQYPD